MTDDYEFEPVYNELETVDGDTYLVQDGPLFDQPMIRKVEDLLEPERTPVNKMMGEKK